MKKRKIGKELTMTEKGMTDAQKNVLYDLKDRMISLEQMVKNSMRRSEKHESQIERHEMEIDSIKEGMAALDKIIALNNVWEKIKSVALGVLAATCGAMASYIFFT